MAQLKGAGIAAFLPDEFLTQADPFHVLSHGFIRVQVPSHQYEAAKQLLVVPDEPFPTQDETEPGGHEELANTPLPWGMMLVALSLPLICGAGLVMFALIKGRYTNRGYERKAREMWHWFAIGCVLYFVAVAILLNLEDSR